MNIPKVTHTPRVESVEARDETWSDGTADVRRSPDGMYVIDFKHQDAFLDATTRDEAVSLLVCLAAALGCEVVQRGEPDKPAPSRPDYVKVTDLRGYKTQPLTVGKVYRVEEWSDNLGYPLVKNDSGDLWLLSGSGAEADSHLSILASWVPADAPAPCEPTDAQVKAAWEAYRTEKSPNCKEWVRAAIKAAMAVKS